MEEQGHEWERIDSIFTIAWLHFESYVLLSIFYFQIIQLYLLELQRVGQSLLFLPNQRSQSTLVHTMT